MATTILNTLNLLDVVVLTEDLPQNALVRGQVGTIVETLAPDIYEVEFSDDAGQTYAMLPLHSSQLLLLHYLPIKTSGQSDKPKEDAQETTMGNIYQFGKRDNIAGDQVNHQNNFNGPMSGQIGNTFNDNAQASDNTFNQTHESQTHETAPLPPLATHEHPLANAKTILFLASNPKQTGRLRLDQELRDIDESLRRAQRRNQFNLENKGAIRLRDFTRAVLDHTPQILHFSGHGLGTAPSTEPNPRKPIAIPNPNRPDPEGLLFEDDQGNPKLIPSEQLAALFDLFSDTVECVILNACYSKNQAEAIAQHIPYVIGMERSISDRGAIEFAIAFYDTLGAGKDIEFAYKLARIALMESNEQDIPKLIHSKKRSPSEESDRSTT